MPADYTPRDDHRFGLRFMGTAVLTSIPVWIGMLLAVWLQWPLKGFLAVGAGTLFIPLTVLTLAFRWTRCPACGQKIRVPWRSTEYRRGGMLRYTCEQCRIVWATHLFPGSDV
ncbi:MAG: zf-TFIIB domain-containing protein [Phycisphaeraceae bacterium]